MTKSDLPTQGERYDHNFYSNRNNQTRYAAEAILRIISELVPPITSAVDLGCGVGTWLAVLKGWGAETVLGYDGAWVDHNLLEIRQEEFQSWDLAAAIEPEQKFDLAISLEVAEHLPTNAAVTFVCSMTKLSDFVLFSAAIPGQSGVNHVNEQWQSFWAKLFFEQDFVPIDIVRPRVWVDELIPFTYRQNTVFYVRRNRFKDLREPVSVAPADSLSIVHPELFCAAMSKSIRKSIQELRKALTGRIFSSLD